jgi:hypothetical protein
MNYELHQQFSLDESLREAEWMQLEARKLAKLKGIKNTTSVEYTQAAIKLSLALITQKAFCQSNPNSVINILATATDKELIRVDTRLLQKYPEHVV